VQRALRVTRAHAAEWNIDPKRLGVIGFSAGGNLSAKASNWFDDKTYDAIDAVDELSCRPDFAVLVYPAYLAQGEKVASDLNLKAKIPPTLIVHSEDDKNFITGSKAYHAALDEMKLPNEFLNYPTGGHGYALHCTKEAKAWPDAALVWMSKIGVIPARPSAPASQPSATAEHKPLRIAIIGDSTVCEYPATRPDRGWGQFIEERFTDGAVKTTNLAAGGRSTKTFIQEGRWQKTLDLKPNYVLIQFGHNDSHAPEKPEATSASTDYKSFLRRYVDESRAIGATPILVTPMVRRTFGDDGKLTDILQPYAASMKEVATEKSVAVIDLHASSKKLVEQLGPEASAEMANKTGDATHFNEKGARAMADLVIKELPTAEPKLKAYLKNP
jgi:lysophospholipase L1-like esterase